MQMLVETLDALPPSAQFGMIVFQIPGMSLSLKSGGDHFLALHAPTIWQILLLEEVCILLIKIKNLRAKPEVSTIAGPSKGPDRNRKVKTQNREDYERTTPGTVEL